MHAERPTRPTRLALLTAAFVIAALLWPTASSATTAIGATTHGPGGHGPSAHGAKPSDEIAQLSLNGALTFGNHLRGRALMIHRGETIQFRLAPSEVQGSRDRTDRHSQITLDSAALPGGGHPVHLNSNSAYRVTFTKTGVYSFHWQAAQAAQRQSLPTTLSHLVQATLNSLQRWTGQIIVDTGLGTGSAAQDARADSAASARQHQSGTVTPAGTGSEAGSASAGSASADTASGDTGSVVDVAKRPADPPASDGTSPRIQEPGPVATPPTPPARAPRAVRRVVPAALPPVATYVFSGLFGFLILGILWMVWVASIRPILGR